MGCPALGPAGPVGGWLPWVWSRRGFSSFGIGISVLSSAPSLGDIFNQTLKEITHLPFDIEGWLAKQMLKDPKI